MDQKLCEKGSCSSNGSDNEANDSHHQHVNDSRTLRSRYSAIKSLIFDERDDISKTDSAKFNSIFNEVESLHHHVIKPREQVADAEALLDITKSLISTAKALNKDGITETDFVNCLLKDFSQPRGVGICSINGQGGRILMDWKKIGAEVSEVFRSCPGFPTMIGPMDTQPKQRRASVHRKRRRTTEDVQPAKVEDKTSQKITNTDGIMIAMFDILRKHKFVRLEHLVLNRNSFAQTVENLFALSFLVKDGRAQITVNEKGFHLVSPKNAPSASHISSKQVVSRQVVLRLDFKDWQMMTNDVEVGQELMPIRNEFDVSSYLDSDTCNGQSEATEPTTVRKKARF